jgi:hypothetical protein
MKKIFFCLLLIFALLFIGTLSFKGKPRVIQAGWMSKIGSARIDEHEICRNVVNSGSKELMVPYKTKEEWCSFLKASLKDVTITKCQVCHWNYCSNGQGRVECNDYHVGSCP